MNNVSAVRLSIVLFSVAGIILGPVRLFAESEKEDNGQASSILAYRQVYEYSSSLARDPFRRMNTKIAEEAKQKSPESSVRPGLPEMEIQGVLWGGNFNQAIINGKVLKEGDTLLGAKILSIERDKVVFYYQGYKIDLPVSAKKPDEKADKY
jgi:hypothetical protein